MAKRRMERKLAAESVATKASELGLEPGSPAKSSEQTMDEEVEPPSPTAVPDAKADQSEGEYGVLCYSLNSVVVCINFLGSFFLP